MRLWYAVVGIAAVIAVIMWADTAGPQSPMVLNESNITVEEPKIIVVSEKGEDVNANIWREGTAWCAEADGFLPNCTHEKEGKVRITLYGDPGAETVEVNVTNCSFFAYGPAGAPIIGPKSCGRVQVKKGRYIFRLFDENGGVVGDYNVLLMDKATVAGKENNGGMPAAIRFYDAESGEEVEGWLTAKGFSLRGKSIVMAVKECTTVFGWGGNHKKRDFRMCPGKEVNAFIPKQLGGGTLIISAPGADRIVVTDREGAVLDSVEGAETVLENVPPGAYVVYAENGASVTAKNVDMGNGQKIITVDIGGGDATLITSEHARVYAMGKKVAEGKGAMKVPARTALQVVTMENSPKTETIVLVPGEVKVIYEERQDSGNV